MKLITLKIDVYIIKHAISSAIIDQIIVTLLYIDNASITITSEISYLDIYESGDYSVSRIILSTELPIIYLFFLF